MRDTNTIDITLGVIKHIWKKYPDLRLGQLLCTPLNFTALYYIEEAELLTALSNFYKVNLSEVNLTKQPENQISQDTLKANMRSVGASNKGKVYIHKASDVRLVAKEYLEKYLNEGFSLGRKDKETSSGSITDNQ